MPARRTRLAAGTLSLILAALVAAACGGEGTDGDAAQAPTTTVVTDSPTTTTTAAPAPPPTTVVPPTTAAPSTTVPEEPVLRPGSSGSEVAAVQARLEELGYWFGDDAGTYGATTAQAVMAFQKVEGLGRDGLAGPLTLERLAGAERPQPRDRDGVGRAVEIDLARQVVLVVSDGVTDLVLNTSTGTTGTRTPPGRFTVTREIDGVRRAPLGDLYRPKYFNAGIALHGSPSIPGYPASHGCARLHDDAMDLLWSADLAPVGTPVWVYGA